MWHSLIAFIDNKTLFQIGIGLCRISFPMRLLLPFERGRPLLQLSSDDSSPAVDSDLSQQKKKKKQTNPNITNLSPLMTRWQPPQPKLPSPAPDIGACPRQSMKGGWRWVWLRTRGCWERSLFGESLPPRGYDTSKSPTLLLSILPWVMFDRDGQWTSTGFKGG